MLGGFSAGLFGRVTNVETVATSHAALTGTAHGAVATATANQIIVRDSSARALVADPPSSDSTGLIATTAWVQGEISAGGGGTVTSVTEGVGMDFSTSPLTATGTINLANTSVTPGTYTFSTVTVDQQGRITSASSGSVVTSVGANAPVQSTGGSTPNITMVAATASVNGYMTNTFATKLNGIATGAEVNDVDTVFGRTGTVTADANDYTIQKIAGVTISNSAPSGGDNGDIWFEY